MQSEQEHDARDYVEAAVRACQRRLDLLDEARARGVYGEELYMNMRAALIAETEQAWGVSIVPEC